MEFKDKMKQYRKENDLTQKELGEKLGLGRSTIAEMERGRIKGKLSVIKKLADLSGMTLSYLMGDNENSEIVNKFEALEVLIDTMIDKKIILSDGKIPTEYHELMIGLLEKEIALKIEKATLM